MRDLIDKIPFKNLISVEPWPRQALRLPRIQSHRGYCQRGLQENTLAAFREARNYGALMVECDIRLSSDKVPVIFHDRDLMRLGQSEERVENLTAQDLAEKVQAPTLRQLLLDPYSPRLVNIELKTNKIVDEPLERKVSEVVKACKAQGRVLFSSFNPFSLWRISQYLPEVPRALLVTQEEHPDNHIVLRKMMMAPFLKLHALHLDYRTLTEADMEFWRRKKMPVAVWTVNGKENIEKYLRWGAVSVITDTLEN